MRVHALYLSQDEAFLFAIHAALGEAPGAGFEVSVGVGKIGGLNIGTTATTFIHGLDKIEF